MSDLWYRLVTGAQQLGAFLPALIVALLILVIGYVVARQLERWVDRVLKRLNFNRVAERGGLSEAVGRTGSRLDPVHATGKLVFWLVMLLVILLSSTALGLRSINEMFGTMLGYMPTLIAAIVIVILGMIVGEFVRGLLLASAGAVEGVPTIARAAKVAVVTISIFMALQQVGVAAEIVTAAFTLVLGAVALGAGLAFGLGNQKLAGEITRRWYDEGRARRAEAEKRAESQLLGEQQDDTPPPGEVTHDADSPDRTQD